MRNDMEKETKRRGFDRGRALIVTVVLFFAVLGSVVFSVSRRITDEMAMSAISNLSESLDLIEGTIGTMLEMEAEYQKLMAKELAETEEPEAFIRFYDGNRTMVKVSMTEAGASEGISGNGEPFTVEGLDFSAGK